MSGEQEMRAKLTPCPECHGECILTEALNNIQLARLGTVLPGITAPTSRLWAVVCTHCGHTAFYAKDPIALQSKR